METRLYFLQTDVTQAFVVMLRYKIQLLSVQIDLHAMAVENIIMTAFKRFRATGTYFLHSDTPSLFVC
jgi:hypothetical protein